MYVQEMIGVVRRLPACDHTSPTGSMGNRNRPGREFWGRLEELLGKVRVTPLE